MAIHTDSSHLLRAIPAAFDGVSVRVLGDSGEDQASFGTAGADCQEVRVATPAGQLVAALPKSSPVEALVRSLLGVIADRERLESDMESMNNGAMRLLEQVAMMGETLPRLSAGGDDVEIATLGVHACQRAAAVRQVVYIGVQAGKNYAEVVVNQVDGAESGANGGEVEPVQPIEGLLADVLAADGVLLRSVPPGGRLGVRGSVEALAQRQLLGVPVTYGSGDKRVTIGAMMLLDRADPDGQELGNEEGQVAESFAAMLGAVLGARKVAALGKELSMAQAIQRQILPDGPIALGGFDVAAGYFACGAVGGDYFDYVPLADGRTMVVVADVSGHNLASGMVMVSARATLRTLAGTHSSPQQVFEALAERMYPDLMQTERFLTAAAVALQPHDGRIDYVSAGHNDLLVYRAATGAVEAHPSDGTILGFLPNPEYATRQITMQPGDCMLLYTDGIPEAVDEAGEMFGEERLAALFAQLAGNRQAQRILDALLQELDSFRGGMLGLDDVTAVVIRCTEGSTQR